MNMVLLGVAILLIIPAVFWFIFWRAIKTYRREDYPPEPYPSSKQDQICSHINNIEKWDEHP